MILTEVLRVHLQSVLSTVDALIYLYLNLTAAVLVFMNYVLVHVIETIRTARPAMKYTVKARS